MLKMEWMSEEGTTTCTVCGRKFNVPDGVSVDENKCEECAGKEATANAANELKSNQPAEMKAAVGN